MGDFCVLWCKNGTSFARTPVAPQMPMNRAARSCYTEASMAISTELLDLLVCPLCKVKVELKQDENGLKCPQCKRVYPIRDDIPVMLVDEARVDEE